MATGIIDGLVSETVNFTFPNNVTAEVNFYKVGAVVFASMIVHVQGNAYFQGGTVVANEKIPTEYRPANQCGTFCSRTDVANSWDAENGDGYKSGSCIRFYPNGNFGMGMIARIITGVDVEGTICYLAAV